MFRMLAGNTAEILLYDDIGALGGITAKVFAGELKRLGKIREINLRINSQGGDVFQAEAIYGALQRHPARVVVDVDGVAASAASFVAMVGDEIRISETGMIMIHRPYLITAGHADELRHKADTLDKMEASIRNVYATRTGNSPDDVAEMMDAETWMDATEAVRLGFADSTTAPIRVAACVDRDRFRNAPPQLLKPLPNYYRSKVAAMTREVTLRR